MNITVRIIRMKSKNNKTPSELRIIAGKFRSRKIVFSEEDGLRPTHNRIRETLFNWLSDTIEDSVCFDVFAGSGALGFEAISRGAKEVVFCDISRTIIDQLKANAQTLSITNAEFIHNDFILQNTVPNKKFDIVFVDPPFQKKLIIPTCELLVSRELLNPHALIYLEFEKGGVDLSQLPKNFIIQKHKQTKTVEYVLVFFSSNTENKKALLV